MSGAGRSLPPAADVSDETVAFAAGLIDRSAKAPVIEAALAARPGAAARCPCRPCSVRCCDIPGP